MAAILISRPTSPTTRTSSIFESIPLTEDLINLLALRHEDLGRAVNERITEHQDPIPPEIQEEITTDQLARATLNGLFRTYARIARAT